MSAAGEFGFTLLRVSAINHATWGEVRWTSRRKSQAGAFRTLRETSASGFPYRATNLAGPLLMKTNALRSLLVLGVVLSATLLPSQANAAHFSFDVPGAIDMGPTSHAGRKNHRFVHKCRWTPAWFLAELWEIPNHRFSRQHRNGCQVDQSSRRDRRGIHRLQREDSRLPASQRPLY